MRKIKNLEKMYPVFYDNFLLKARMMLTYLTFMIVWKYSMKMVAGTKSVYSFVVTNTKKNLNKGFVI